MTQHGDQLVLIVLLKRTRGTLETKVSMRKSMDLLLMINLYSHNHGEELKKLTQSMDLRIHHSNGLINQLPLHNKKREISVIKVSMRKSMDLPPTTDLFFHNHGEEPRKLIHKMDSRTQLSNGSINQLLSLNKKKRISATKVSMRKSMDLLPTTDLSFHNHGEELRKHIHKTDSKTQLSNGLIRSHLPR
jgi:hypothetical protein